MNILLMKESILCFIMQIFEYFPQTSYISAR